MRKSDNIFIVTILSFLSFCVAILHAEERLTLTTYYPAPYGVYKELRADQMTVGSTYRNSALSDGKLLVSGGVGIGTANPQNKLQIHNTTANDHLLISGTAPGIQFSDSEGGQEKAAIGLATTNNHYTPNSQPDDLVIRTVTNQGRIIFATGLTNPAIRGHVWPNGIWEIVSGLGINTSLASGTPTKLSVNGDTILDGKVAIGDKLGSYGTNAELCLEKYDCAWEGDNNCDSDKIMAGYWYDRDDIWCCRIRLIQCSN